MTARLLERAHPQPLTVDRKFRGREGTAQLPDPIGSMNFAKSLIQPGPLPIGIVRILHGQRGKASLLSITSGFPQKGQLLPEDTERPPVGDETVEGQRQYVHILLKRQQSHPE